jgi:hypothetical protein
VPGDPRDQRGQVLQSLKLAGSLGTTAYRGASKKDGVALYRSGTQDNTKSPNY